MPEAQEWYERDGDLCTHLCTDIVCVLLGVGRPTAVWDLGAALSHSLTSSFSAGAMAQWVKALATKPDDLSLDPNSGGRKSLFQIVF